jgi:hypothetical protein
VAPRRVSASGAGGGAGVGGGARPGARPATNGVGVGFAPRPGGGGGAPGTADRLSGMGRKLYPRARAMYAGGDGGGGGSVWRHVAIAVPPLGGLIEHDGTAPELPDLGVGVPGDGPPPPAAADCVALRDWAVTTARARGLLAGVRFDDGVDGGGGTGGGR